MSAFPVTFDPAATAHLASALRRKGLEGQPVRVGVKGGGCSGLEYFVQPGAEPRDGDLSDQQGEVTFLCDPKSAKFLLGTTVGWSGNLIGGGFTFDNPNAARSCGCGTSFTPKPQP